MARWRGTLMIGGLVAALVLSAPARAADGQITFTGLIVEPTCALSADHLASLVSAAASRGSCGQAGTDAGSRYDLAVSTLTAGRQADQLLSYFAGNAQTIGATARLVTQTYE